MTEHVHTPDDPRVFVFGANEAGIHGAGAARYAREKLGARGYLGLMPPSFPRAFALPTCHVPGVALPLDRIKIYVDFFLFVARERPDLQFFVSRVGCGLAGYTDADIAPMFAGAPANCDLPPGWR